MNANTASWRNTGKNDECLTRFANNVAGHHLGGTSFILELRARAMRKFRDGGYNTGLLEGFPKEGGGGDEIYRTIFLDREGTDSAA